MKENVARTRILPHDDLTRSTDCLAALARFLRGLPFGRECVMYCKCMRCGRRIELSVEEAERFREFFEKQFVECPREAFGICPGCWVKNAGPTREH